MGLVKKLAIFPCFYFRQNRPGIILERKNAFLDYKNKKLKESKYWDFF